MESRELRKRFLQYFEKNGHRIYPSSPVVPHDDPTLLFTNAGMNQFKKVFLGQTQLESKRAATSQKCIRVGGKHNDLDNVGHTSRHLTFFEMLGNFSFGDYFKEEAIRFAWELSTKILEIDTDRLFVSVFEEDDEAYELWQSYMPEERIVRIGAKDNFWAMGDTGPCGPCTELFFDRGETFGKARNPKEDVAGERFFEFWNLVFMQYNRDESGHKHPLPKPCVDTGMGLERMISLKMGVDTLFQTDVLASIIHSIEDLAKVKYATNRPAFHVIADHLRSLSFAIADGAQPGNVERGYVLRKILRRAVRYARQIKLEKPFLRDLLPTLLAKMGDDYPELVSSQERIAEILTTEEESFLRTLRRGGNILTSVIENAKSSQKFEISGEEAFKLKDTYGFPLEEILLLAKDNNLNVNLESFALLEEKAKELSKGAMQKHVQKAESSLFASFLEKYPPTEFVGYTETETNASIVGILVNGAFQDRLEEGQEASILLDRTPCYAEMGGQVGDKGALSHHGASFTITNCTSPFPGISLHHGVLKHGILLLGEPVDVSIEKHRRDEVVKNHTATHLLHWALEEVLGGHIRQAGSLVGVDRIRFDFSHHKALTAQEIRQIEEKINDKIREACPVDIKETSFDSVKNRTDVKQFFGEKYGETVRLVSIGDFSKELCGGIHVGTTHEIGLFRIVKESSVAQGVRRIEAVTNKLAENFMYEKEDLLHKVANLLDSPESKLIDSLNNLLLDHKKGRDELKKVRAQHLKTLRDELYDKRIKVDHTACILAEVEIAKDEFAPLAQDLMNKLGSGAVLLALKDESRCQLLLKLSPDLISQGYSAVELIQQIAPLIEGSGGGKKDTAQAGGKNAKGIEEAFSKLKTSLCK